MTKNYDNINKTLNVESSIVEVEEVSGEIVSERIENNSVDVQKDYQYARANLYSLIDKGQEAVNGALELASECDSPRAYEVTGQLIKNIGDVVDKLMELQKDVKNVSEDKSSKSPNSITNNSVFFGSTSELLKALKLNNKEEK
jgi:hypothetical protein